MSHGVKNRDRAYYPFEEMKIGESFECDKTPIQVRGALWQYNNRKKRDCMIKIKIESNGGQIRVWRIE